MTDPEQAGGENLSRPGVDRNVSVQDGADKVYDRPEPRGKNIIMWVSLVLAAIVAVGVGIRFF